MAALFTAGKFQAIDNLGLAAPGAQLFTYQAGTLVPLATYTNQGGATPNANPVVCDAGGKADVWLGTASYRFILKTALGATIWDEDNITVDPTNSVLSSLYPTSAAETTAGITPTSFAFTPGDPRRYGADPTGVADTSTPIQKCFTIGLMFLVPGTSYKVVTPAVRTGQMVIVGNGKTSKLLCDSLVATVTNGTNSIYDNFWMENITAPWIITRNPANWAASVIGTLQQSNTVLGYQPTSNDTDVYPSLTTPQKTQAVGPSLVFSGAASGISVTRIYGRFVTVTIADATDSLFEDCDIRGGKGTWGALVFDNATNSVQRGVNNAAINNRVRYSSNNGVIHLANDDFIQRGNYCYLGGESGTKTCQAGGVVFTTNVAGATSGTLTAVWPGLTGTWALGFNDGTTRSVTLTNGSAAVSWTGALAAGIIYTAAVWGALGAPPTTLDPRCYRGQIEGNRAWGNYFDGLDCFGTFGTTNDATRSMHQIVSNYAYNNRLDGINADGQGNQIHKNACVSNGAYGIFATTAYSDIGDNFCWDNNTSRLAGNHDIAVLGLLANNRIGNNFVYGGPGQNNFGIFAPPTALGSNDDINNRGVGSTFNFGNVGAITGISRGRADSTTGPVTPQSFCFELVNNAGTLQHIFYADASGGTAGRFERINGATSGGFTTTPNGADASTAFAAGAKIGATTTNMIWLDTASQNAAFSLIGATIVYSSIGPVSVQPVQQSININGVTRVRLGFQIWSLTAGAAVPLNTTTITNAQRIYIQFNGELT